MSNKNMPPDQCAPRKSEGWDDQAYATMRDDLESWKNRALTAEADVARMCEAFNAENGPTHMGEPILPSFRDTFKRGCHSPDPKYTPAIAALTQPKGSTTTNPAEISSKLVGDAYSRMLTTLIQIRDRDLFGHPSGILNSVISEAEAALSLPRQSEAAPLGYIRDTDAAFLKEKFAGQCTILICQKPQNKKALAIYTTPQPAQADTTPAAHGVDYKERYQDLIMQVGNKYPGETRHDTAKRYLQRAEQSGSESQAATAPGGK